MYQVNRIIMFLGKEGKSEQFERLEFRSWKNEELWWIHHRGLSEKVRILLLSLLLLYSYLLRYASTVLEVYKINEELNKQLKDMSLYTAQFGTEAGLSIKSRLDYYIILYQAPPCPCPSRSKRTARRRATTWWTSTTPRITLPVCRAPSCCPWSPPCQRWCCRWREWLMERGKKDWTHQWAQTLS